MVSFESTTRPSVSPISTPSCGHCGRRITKAILADQTSYCGELCAALGLIARVNARDGIDDRIGGFEQLIANATADKPDRVLYPVKVRDCDADDFRFPENAVMILIDDSGTPDWFPDSAR